MKATFLIVLLMLISACSSSEHETSKDNTSSLESSEVKKLQSACDLGSGKDCDQLATLLMNGQQAEDHQKIITLLNMGCDIGYTASCTHLANIYVTPKMVEEDFTKAAELYEKACSAGEHEACSGKSILRRPRR
jgi:hypothetical protein